MTPAQGWGSFIREQMGMPLDMVPVVIASAVIIYLAFLLIVRVFGSRVFAATSFSSTVGFVMLGALAGRAILGPTPTVSAGILALLTLVAMESMFHAVENSTSARFALGGRPILVYVDGAAVEEACRRTHTTLIDLNSAMRSAGVVRPDDVRCIILEPHGHYSVIRTGTELSPELFTHVDGADMLFSRGDPAGNR